MTAIKGSLDTYHPFHWICAGQRSQEWEVLLHEPQPGNYTAVLLFLTVGFDYLGHPDEVS